MVRSIEHRPRLDLRQGTGRRTHQDFSAPSAITASLRPSTRICICSTWARVRAVRLAGFTSAHSTISPLPLSSAAKTSALQLNNVRSGRGIWRRPQLPNGLPSRCVGDLGRMKLGQEWTTVQLRAERDMELGRRGIANPGKKVAGKTAKPPIRTHSAWWATVAML